MAAFLQTLRAGDWLTLSRMRLWALAVLAASAVGLVFLVATSDGLNDYQRRPLGTDFSSSMRPAPSCWKAGRTPPTMAPALCARQQELFGAATPSMAGSIRRSSCSSPARWRCCLICLR